MSRERLNYSFGPLERRGLLGALRVPQALLLFAAAVTGVAVLDAAPTGYGAAFALLLLTAALGATALPIAGLSISEWAPVALGHSWRRLGGGHRSPLPEAGLPVSDPAGAPGMPNHSGPGHRRSGRLRSAQPRHLRRVNLQEIRYHERTIGAISDAGSRTLTSVLACSSGSYAMLDAEAQERRLARWGQILSAAASGPVRRIGWVERTAPAQGDELARHLHAERDPAVPLRGTPLIDSYLELIDSTARVSHEHEVLLAVQIDCRRAGRDPEAVLITETERVARALEGAEVSVLGALTVERLARALRTAFDPYAGGELATLEAAHPRGRSIGPAAPWPLADREEWDRYIADGAEHATWWVSSWPRVQVSPMFMEALLARSPAVRTFAVTFEPVPPGRSTRAVEAQVTRDRADGELRRRFGQSETARQRQAREANSRREAELAQGHGEVLMTGFVTVSGRTGEELRRACAEVLDQAARSRLELRRMYGRQAEAFTFTLPLCRGLR